jgi:hypothetical protein
MSCSSSSIADEAAGEGGREGKAYNGVDTGHLLADHEHDGDESTLAVAGNGDHLLEKSLGGSITSQTALGLELGSHVLDLIPNVIGIGGEAVVLLVSHPIFSRR